MQQFGFDAGGFLADFYYSMEVFDEFENGWTPDVWVDTLPRANWGRGGVANFAFGARFQYTTVWEHAFKTTMNSSQGAINTSQLAEIARLLGSETVMAELKSTLAPELLPMLAALMEDGTKVASNLAQGTSTYPSDPYSSLASSNG